MLTLDRGLFAVANLVGFFAFSPGSSGLVDSADARLVSEMTNNVFLN